MLSLYTCFISCLCYTRVWNNYRSYLRTISNPYVCLPAIYNPTCTVIEYLIFHLFSYLFANISNRSSWGNNLFQFRKCKLIASYTSDKKHSRTLSFASSHSYINYIVLYSSFIFSYHCWYSRVKILNNCTVSSFMIL